MSKVKYPFHRSDASSTLVLVPSPENPDKAPWALEITPEEKVILRYDENDGEATESLVADWDTFAMLWKTILRAFENDEVVYEAF